MGLAATIAPTPHAVRSALEALGPAGWLDDAECIALDVEDTTYVAVLRTVVQHEAVGAGRVTTVGSELEALVCVDHTCRVEDVDPEAFAALWDAMQCSGYAL